VPKRMEPATLNPQTLPFFRSGEVPPTEEP